MVTDKQFAGFFFLLNIEMCDYCLNLIDDWSFFCKEKIEIFVALPFDWNLQGEIGWRKKSKYANHVIIKKRLLQVTLLRKNLFLS